MNDAELLGGRGRDANDFAIAGWTRLSTVDWPGKLATVVFAQGCPWRCRYCHNADILDPRLPGQVSWRQVRAFLERRRGLLDGVVFSGGEPTRQRCLAAAMIQSRQLGFAVGLHTGGAYPKTLASLLEAGLVDWVGLDVKALPGAYRQVVGVENAGERAWESLDLVLAYSQRECSFDYEVRLTTFPAFPGCEVDLVRQLQVRGVKNFALQRARGRSSISGEDYEAPLWQREFSQRAAAVLRETAAAVTVRD